MRIQLKTTAVVMTAMIICSILAIPACQKQIQEPADQSNSTGPDISLSAKNNKPNYNLEVRLTGETAELGHIHFRQDRSPEKIIDLKTRILNLKSNHGYLLQRAVDMVLDGNCTGTNWLALGFGLVPHTIMTDGNGNGEADLWRDVSAVPSGSTFDIHFRVIDAISGEVVLNSGCYEYTVR